MKKNIKVLISGCGGLIGSEAAAYYLEKGATVIGIDNNLRKYFFGDAGDTSGNIKHLARDKNFKNRVIDIRNREKVLALFKEYGPFNLIIHTAAQPSHDWAKQEPFTDFDVNAVGTFNMLEAFRLLSPKGVFIFTSTNKVYGDRPNEADLVESEYRYDFAKKNKIAGVTTSGVSELMSLDQCTHSLFGASKVSADIIAQEYGKYFNLNVGVFRGGCLTGPQHSAVPLHGFLAYIIDCAVHGRPYQIIGYKGKQVRDQIHSKDVVAAFHEFYKNPRKGVVYNLGGGKGNSASINEIIKIIEKKYGYKLNTKYIDVPRVGDHICYYTDLRKFKRDYPNWRICWTLPKIIDQIVKSKVSG